MNTKEIMSTPEGVDMDDQIVRWAEKQQLEEGAAHAAAIDILAVCEKHFPDDNNLEAPEMLAEAFVGMKLLENLDDMLTIYEALVKYGYTEDAEHEWNDGENRLFYIPHKHKVWCATSQNTRYVFIIEYADSEVIKIHVRRYWDPVEEPHDKWEVRDRAKYNFEYAVQMASWNRERWSDNLPGNRYVRRPDLQWWKDHNFKPRYGDCRDVGYVMSLDLLNMRQRVDRAIYFMSDIKMAFFEIQCALGMLRDE